VARHVLSSNANVLAAGIGIYRAACPAGTIVLETQLVASLTDHVRRVPWMQLTAAATGGGPPLAGAHRALRLLENIFKLVHHDGPGSPGSAQPGSRVLNTLLQQVCAKRNLLAELSEGSLP